MAPVPDIAYHTLNDLDHSWSMAPGASNTLPMGEYIFRRIQSLGVSSVFGVPGDFNLNLLEHLYSVEGMSWVGCANELNSAYAADGYSRASNKMGCVITTFGVGELSAINGISGAFSEYVPILHIVGTTPLSAKIAENNHTHHLVPKLSVFEPSDHFTYEKMVAPVSCHQETVVNASDAPGQIDTLIKQILKYKRPGYLFLPSDLADINVDGDFLIQRTAQQFYQSVDTNQSLTREVATKVLDKIYNCSNPAVLGDILCDRFQVTEHVRAFVKNACIKSFSTFMGKSVLDESDSKYIGTYNGVESNNEVIGYFQASDLILHIGNYYNEINSGHDTLYNNIDEEQLILMHPEYIKIGTELFRNVNFVHVLDVMLQMMDVSQIPRGISPTLSKKEINHIEHISASTPISQTHLLHKLQDFIKEDDFVVVETGSIMFGLPDLVLPKGARLFGQHFYLSIGYALPAALGVGVAMKDGSSKGRLILLEGDGSAQMTIQEFGNYVYQQITPIIFLLNNSGYTVERIIKGPQREYNDILPNWNWTEVFKTFGDRYESKSETKKIQTVEELDQVMLYTNNNNFKLKLFEVILDQMDVPWRFSYMTAASKNKAKIVG
ncbi:hypothetical protein LJB42_004771 [Komagataella kurtzmanii]|nr:hypothetical protein LJB42_004771 [Komagataella kurtzmanii]